MTKTRSFIDQINTTQTLLGLDFGDKTIGIAVSDKTKTIATPIMTLKRKGIEKDIKILFSSSIDIFFDLIVFKVSVIEENSMLFNYLWYNKIILKFFRSIS